MSNMSVEQGQLLDLLSAVLDNADGFKKSASITAKIGAEAARTKVCVLSCCLRLASANICLSVLVLSSLSVSLINLSVILEAEQLVQSCFS